MKFTPTKKENYWVSLSDIMTVLMVIFMFIAITYIRQVMAEQDAQNKILEEYQETYVALYDALETEFEDDFRENRWHAELSEDLSIRFLNEEVLFEYNSTELKDEFRQILQEFFPRYLEVLLNDEFRNKIAEVRIEGHTDSNGPYMFNVDLSQNRTSNVLDFLFNRTNSEYSSMSPRNQELLRFWFTTTGFSYGRTLDQNGNLTHETGEAESEDRSRRVEFRIVMKSEEVLDQVLEMMNE